MPDLENLAKTEIAARQSYEKDLRLAISCLADVNLLTKWSKKYERWLLLVSQRASKGDVTGQGSLDDETGFLMLKRKDGSKLFLELDQHVQVLKVNTDKGARYRVSTVRYIYAIWKSPDDCLVGWHYHPDLDVAFPHVHVYDKTDEAQKMAGCKPFMLNGMHMPSGRVSLEEVIKFAIIELEVIPEKKRAEDWEKILSETGDRFETNKTWGQRAPSA